jgi:hypothetical protein
VTGSFPITITGQGFLDLPSTGIFIDNQAAPIFNITSTTIELECPPLSVSKLPGPVDVEIQNADGQNITIQNGFTYTHF